jgi:hypothetical protein
MVIPTWSGPAALPFASDDASRDRLCRRCHHTDHPGGRLPGLAFLVFAALIDEVGPVRATVITYFYPAVAAVLGVLVLHEDFSPAMAIGFALVILGSTLATRTSRPAEAPRLVAT